MRGKNDNEKNVGGQVWVVRLIALVLLIAGTGIGYFSYSSERVVLQDNQEVTPDARFPFKLGLDLAGGSHLVYSADTSQLALEDVPNSMSALRDVIERRVNIFGVSEPIVQVEKNSIFAGGEQEERLIVELPGVTDIAEAVALIGATPVLEFKLLKSDAALPEEGVEDFDFNIDELFIPTGLTGRLLKGAQLEFGSTQSGQVSNEPIILLEFNSEGSKLFADITGDNIGETLAIFLDGEPISMPVIRDKITGGRATISGGFLPDEARLLVRDLNFGALPVPIELISTQTIGASLGEEALQKGIRAGIWGLILVALFLIVWYRLPGVAAVLSLAIYIAAMLALFKLIPVTLTAAGLAGFILSIGMAVDANILIFERIKEELKDGKETNSAVKDGFARAWLPIRDGNISSIITAVVLFWFGTSLVKGFALTFGIGILVSMLTAISVSRTFLYALGNYENKGMIKILFGSGLGK